MQVDKINFCNSPEEQKGTECKSSHKLRESRVQGTVIARDEHIIYGSEGSPRSSWQCTTGTLGCSVPPFVCSFTKTHAACSAVNAYANHMSKTHMSVAAELRRASIQLWCSPPALPSNVPVCIHSQTYVQRSTGMTGNILGILHMNIGPATVGIISLNPYKLVRFCVQTAQIPCQVHPLSFQL